MIQGTSTQKKLVRAGKLVEKSPTRFGGDGAGDHNNLVVQEAAQRVVELQKQLTVVTRKLKLKEKVAHDNVTLQEELELLKKSYMESQKKQI